MSEVRSYPLPFSELAQLDLVANFGMLSVQPVEEGGTARLEVKGSPGVGVEVSKEGDVVHARVGHAVGAFFEMGPNVKLAAYVPKSVRAHVRTEFGKVSVEHLNQGCDLNLATSAGAIFLDDVVGRMVLWTGAGKIAGDKLAGAFDVETSAGAVRLGISGLQPGTHKIRTSMGSVRVSLTPGIAVRIDAKTQMGSVRKRYPSTDGAPAVLELATDLGSVRVDEGSETDSRHGDFPRWEASGSGMDPGAFARGWAGAWSGFFGGEPKKRNIRDEELGRILTMVEQGKITAADAERLIRAIEDR